MNPYRTTKTGTFFGTTNSMSLTTQFKDRLLEHLLRTYIDNIRSTECQPKKSPTEGGSEMLAELRGGSDEKSDEQKQSGKDPKNGERRIRRTDSSPNREDSSPKPREDSSSRREKSPLRINTSPQSSPRGHRARGSPRAMTSPKSVKRTMTSPRDLVELSSLLDDSPMNAVTKAKTDGLRDVAKGITHSETHSKIVSLRAITNTESGDSPKALTDVSKPLSSDQRELVQKISSARSDRLLLKDLIARVLVDVPGGMSLEGQIDEETFPLLTTLQSVYAVMFGISAIKKTTKLRESVISAATPGKIANSGTASNTRHSNSVRESTKDQIQVTKMGTVEEECERGPNESITDITEYFDPRLSRDSSVLVGTQSEILRRLFPTQDIGVQTEDIIDNPGGRFSIESSMDFSLVPSSSFIYDPRKSMNKILRDHTSILRHSMSRSVRLERKKSRSPRSSVNEKRKSRVSINEKRKFRGTVHHRRSERLSANQRRCERKSERRSERLTGEFRGSLRGGLKSRKSDRRRILTLEDRARQRKLLTKTTRVFERTQERLKKKREVRSESPPVVDTNILNRGTGLENRTTTKPAESLSKNMVAGSSHHFSKRAIDENSLAKPEERVYSHSTTDLECPRPPFGGDRRVPSKMKYAGSSTSVYGPPAYSYTSSPGLEHFYFRKPEELPAETFLTAAGTDDETKIHESKALVAFHEPPVVSIRPNQATNRPIHSPDDSSTMTNHATNQPHRGFQGTIGEYQQSKRELQTLQAIFTKGETTEVTKGETTIESYTKLRQRYEKLLRELGPDFAVKKYEKNMKPGKSRILPERCDETLAIEDIATSRGAMSEPVSKTGNPASVSPRRKRKPLSTFGKESGPVLLTLTDAEVAPPEYNRQDHSSKPDYTPKQDYNQDNIDVHTFLNTAKPSPSPRSVPGKCRFVDLELQSRKLHLSILTPGTNNANLHTGLLGRPLPATGGVYEPGHDTKHRYDAGRSPYDAQTNPRDPYNTMNQQTAKMNPQKHQRPQQLSADRRPIEAIDSNEMMGSVSSSFNSTFVTTMGGSETKGFFRRTNPTSPASPKAKGIMLSTLEHAAASDGFAAQRYYSDTPSQHTQSLLRYPDTHRPDTQSQLRYSSEETMADPNVSQEKNLLYEKQNGVAFFGNACVPSFNRIEHAPRTAHTPRTESDPQQTTLATDAVKSSFEGPKIWSLDGVIPCLQKKTPQTRNFNIKDLLSFGKLTNRDANMVKHQPIKHVAGEDSTAQHRSHVAQGSKFEDAMDINSTDGANGNPKFGSFFINPARRRIITQNIQTVKSSQGSLSPRNIDSQNNSNVNSTTNLRAKEASSFPRDVNQQSIKKDASSSPQNASLAITDALIEASTHPGSRVKHHGVNDKTDAFWKENSMQQAHGSSIGTDRRTKRDDGSAASVDRKTQRAGTDRRVRDSAVEKVRDSGVVKQRTTRRTSVAKVDSIRKPKVAEGMAGIVGLAALLANEGREPTTVGTNLGIVEEED